MINSYLESEINKFTIEFKEFYVIVKTDILDPTHDLVAIAEQLSLIHATTTEEILNYLTIWIDKAIKIKDSRLAKSLTNFDVNKDYETNICNFIASMIEEDINEEYSREFLIQLFNDFYQRTFINGWIKETLNGWDKVCSANTLFRQSNIIERVNNTAFVTGKILPIFETEFIKYFTPIFIEEFKAHVDKGLHYNDFYNIKLENESDKVRKHFDDLLPTIFENDKLEERLKIFMNQIVLTIGQVTWVTSWAGHGRMKAEDAYILMNEHHNYKKDITTAVTKWRDSEIERRTMQIMGITE